MSYILDALKRADAERSRGSVPGLHVRQTVEPVATGWVVGHRIWWLAFEVVLALAALVGWFWWTGSANHPDAAAVRPPIAPTTSTVLPSAQIHDPLPIADTPASAVAQPVVPVKPQVPLSVVVAPVKVIAPSTVKPANDSTARPLATSTPALPLLIELPEALRREIPSLAITGAVYSDNPAQRLLLVNNLVLNQGSQVAPELKLEEIHAKESVFNFRGTRFRLGH